MKFATRKSGVESVYKVLHEVQKKIRVAVQLLYMRVLTKNANAPIQVSGGSRRGEK